MKFEFRTFFVHVGKEVYFHFNFGLHYAQLQFFILVFDNLMQQKIIYISSVLLIHLRKSDSFDGYNNELFHYNKILTRTLYQEV